MKRTRFCWDCSSVRALRRHLSLTQAGLADELGVRQQTISEWETGVYRPRGSSVTVLSLIAERAAFSYQVVRAAETDDVTASGSQAS